MSHDREHEGGHVVEIRANTVLPARREPLTLRHQRRADARR